jgi:hypothetical protein
MFYRLTDETTKELLDAAFGPTEEKKQAQLENCSCPHCVRRKCILSINEVENANDQNSGIRLPQL